MNAIQRFFFNILLCCCVFGLLFFNKLSSYASDSLYWIDAYVKSDGSLNYSWRIANQDYSSKICLFRSSFSGETRLVIYSDNPNLDVEMLSYQGSDTPFRSTIEPVSGYYQDQYYYTYTLVTALNLNLHTLNTDSKMYVFDTVAKCLDYLFNDEPSGIFDPDLTLDSFKVTSWQIGNLQALFKSKFEVKWSNPLISVVQVSIAGPANSSSYESSSSPFKGKFAADQFVYNKGDVIHLVATPFKSDGTYGESLYYSVTYNDNIPFSNNYRKMVNNNTNDNTLTIPYSGTSGNDSVTLPVDGVTTNVTYKVNYNPVTNEYGDFNLYEIYYSPVVVYPDNTSDQEVDETQDTIINNYNTTNYYDTTKNINLNFDIDFGDISTNDIGEGFNGVSGFLNGFGGFIGRLSNWILVLFPFLPPIVATSIVFMFGLVILIAGIALILKIIGAVGNIIDVILPL